ncbi:MAG: hypothetical protein M1814_005193 [Vezdaea aestivalis]|nr:MAG: hypothetical protein M1814_005193 [Vezdaea aestivalis]
MNKVRQVAQLNQRELDNVIQPEASWHADYRDTAYIYIGGLPFEASEGDVVQIFSQYGEPVHLNLVRDRETGKSKGFAFLKYEDQRSTDLAVDNIGGATIGGRILSVDHTRYKAKDGENIGDNTERGVVEEDDPTSETKSDDGVPNLKEQLELDALIREHDDEDPMKEFLINEKREQLKIAFEKVERRERKHRHRRHHHHHRHRSSRTKEERFPRRRPDSESNLKNQIKEGSESPRESRHDQRGETSPGRHANVSRERKRHHREDRYGEEKASRRRSS